MARPAHPEAIFDAVRDLWNARDAEGFAALFAEDADFVNVVGLWWQKRRDIARAHAYGFERIFAQAEMRILERKLRRLDARHCVLHMKWRLTGQTGPDGVEAGARQGIFVFVVTDTDEGWQIVAAQNTDIVAGAETHLADKDGALSGLSYR